MSEPTREQLIDHFDSNRCWMSDCIGCKAIRKLIEQPTVTVSREKIKDVMRDNYIPWELGDFILLLTELGIKMEEQP